MSNLRSTRATLTPAEASAFVQLIADAGDVQARSQRTFTGSGMWPHWHTVNAMNRLGLTADEIPEWRSLTDQGFSTEEAANILIRSRRGDRA